MITDMRIKMGFEYVRARATIKKPVVPVVSVMRRVGLEDADTLDGTIKTE